MKKVKTVTKEQTNKRGFVLMETIVVITVLCVILIILYASYSGLLVSLKKKSNFDNTEYVYKTSVIRKYLEPKIDVQDLFQDKLYGVYCSNSLADYDDCVTVDTDGYELFRFLRVHAIYVTEWNANLMGVGSYIELEATTQSYISYLDQEILPGLAYRVIVMFETEDDHYEYASLRFGSRG